MKIYTKTGDKGHTGLVGGSRISKASDRIQAIGDVDELNATIGLARTAGHGSELDSNLEWLQSALFDVGAELACVPGGRISVAPLADNVVERLEKSIDAQTESLPLLQSFILPGGSKLGAHLHLARCVCRRAERSVLCLHGHEPVRKEVLVFLNRLSDWLFVAARTANRNEKIEDVPWKAAETSG
ncbi:MAG: cob(I)alamin adenosyltransferase [Fimbriimonadaceae bacterium]|jgi:cob(I)alamin adenosyltransferase|nr:cob(I)alamin adenosyltransferase [Fimbriimonadaceae bacterium]